MQTGEKYNFFEEWQAEWLKQSKVFFESTEKNLNEIFSGSVANFQDQISRIQEWIEMLKKQWEIKPLSDEENVYQAYLNVMTDIYNNAADLLQTEWSNRIKAQKPIRNARELYELWLDCCNVVYEQALRTKAYQEAFLAFMNSAYKLWKTSINK